MTDENRRASIQLEVQHGGAALRAAAALRGLGLYNDAVSRLYYAVFRYVTALLLTEGIEARTHRSIAGLLGQHFVRRGLLTAADVASVSRAYGHRDLADYERTWLADDAFVIGATVEAEALITKVRALLATGGWTDPP